MLCKILIATVFLGAASASLAANDGIWADGFVTYKHPSGALVNRDCRLFVPSRGQGNAQITCGEWTASTGEFTTRKEHDKVTFSVLFRDNPGAPAGTAALYTGAYLRGSNKALYYGDVYNGSGSELTFDVASGWSYAGGFMFAKEIE